MFRALLAASWLMGVILYWYKRVKPPAPRVYASPNAPGTSPRITLSDGRNLAYKERGVPKDVAKHVIILVHGYNSSKDVYLPLSQAILKEMDACILTYDRAGYGESDPNPKRSVKREALDIQELADKLRVGPKFYVIGISIGTYATWACLKYIPHRLAGAMLVVPAINYWWPSFPPKLANEAFKKQPKRDQVKLAIAHHFPSLLYWWMTQNLFPNCSITQQFSSVLSERDRKTFKEITQVSNPPLYNTQQESIYETLCRDMMVHFGEWEFDPMTISNPLHDEASTYLWQGLEDMLVPSELQRWVAHKLPWIKYHEVPDGGHLLIHEECLCEAMFKQLLFGEEPLSFL